MILDSGLLFLGHPVHILVIITAVTQNHGKSRKFPKIRAQGENHGRPNHGDREFVVYMHP